MSKNIQIDWTNSYFDYLDFGCSFGGSIEYNNAIFPGACGLGIDIDNNKISRAVNAGHSAIVYDILKLPEKKLSSFVTMSHFLEHLPGVREAEKMLAKAISISTDFVFIRQPWFDSDGALFEIGLKFYWSHWRAHPNKMTCLDFFRILQHEFSIDRIKGFYIWGHTKVEHSDVYSILPLEAPGDSHHYDIMSHGAKKTTALNFTAFKEVMVLVDISNAGKSEPLINSFGQMELLFSKNRATTPAISQFKN